MPSEQKPDEGKRLSADELAGIKRYLTGIGRNDSFTQAHDEAARVFRHITALEAELAEAVIVRDENLAKWDQAFKAAIAHQDRAAKLSDELAALKRPVDDADLRAVARNVSVCVPWLNVTGEERDRNGWHSTAAMHKRSATLIERLEAIATRLAREKAEARDKALEEAARIADRSVVIGSECESLGPMDWETGVRECALERTSGCICAERSEAAEQIRDAIRALSPKPDTVLSREGEGS